MDMSTQSGHELGVVDISVESTLHRRGNLLASPLLRLPTELILEIFAYAVEPDDDDDDRGLLPLVLTAICHQLRETGIASPQLWSTVDLTTPPIAELFLERCKYDPHTLMRFPSIFEVEPDENPRRDTLWEKLEGRAFNRLRSIVFEGTRHEFARRVVGVLQRAPNVSNLNLCSLWSDQQKLPWPVGDTTPNLSTLRLSGFSIRWTSPLLRNLTQLVLDFLPEPFSKYTSIEVFLTALANCPNLEILDLKNTGPDLLYGRQERCDTVVQLCRLQGLSLEFRDPYRVGYILSHIGYPESVKLGVCVSLDMAPDLPETLSQFFPHRNAQAIQHFRRSTALTIHLDDDPRFFTDNFLVHFQEPDTDFGFLSSPQISTQFASKIVDIVGGDTIISLVIKARGNCLPNGMWEVLLHGLPQLEQIRYHHLSGDGDRPLVDSFVLIFSQLFEGSPVCPRLQCLELPKGALAQDASVTALKCALTERDACGRRLRWMGLSDVVARAEDRLALEQFRDLVDEVE